MQKVFSNDVQKALRDENIISESEVAYEVGDKHVAENILTKTRIEISVPGRLLEGAGKRRVLRG